VNSQVVHGIPNEKVVLKDGDIVSIDCGLILDGYYSDAAVTYAVGKASPQTQKLLDVTRASLEEAIKFAVVGGRLFDIGAAVQTMCEAEGFGVVRDFVGHGIGRSMHEDPQVPNFGTKGKGPRLKEGMVLAIEPMINAGKPDVKTLKDGWTAVTVDGSYSAHFEHTVAITKDGPYVLTR
jgi:methionyl aminopeptidase